jgi:hypothetical protein
VDGEKGGEVGKGESLLLGGTMKGTEVREKALDAGNERGHGAIYTKFKVVYVP